ncbi:hypothetical protein DCCM_2996 [Desulfocucumis palustris]|uniref:Uncharacterized protein n=1 Tax=Desulfocucumis palustris TaxID=1898651 RepID=A0A2L2XCC7_9FIRM|nr:hypothetical protein DCCM_2996 [Desulfocucumis palustris]
MKLFSLFTEICIAALWRGCGSCAGTWRHPGGIFGFDIIYVAKAPI